MGDGPGKAVRARRPATDLSDAAGAGKPSVAADERGSAREDLIGDGADLRVVKPRQTGWNMVATVLDAANLAVPPVFESLANAVARFEQVSAVKGGSDDRSGRRLSRY